MRKITRKYWLPREVYDIANYIGLGNKHRRFDRRDLWYWEKQGVFPEPELKEGDTKDSMVWYANDQVDCGLIDIGRRLGKEIDQELLDMAKGIVLSSNRAKNVSLMIRMFKRKEIR